LVINLFFLQFYSSELNNHILHTELQLLLDNAPLTINISIDKEFIQEEQQTIIKNSEEESKFIIDLIEAIGRIETTIIMDKDMLENIV